ncbi:MULTISPECIES: TraR/DksA C4-type zinc finger protein [unclassified Motilimonas]|uniref:TraR/DksA family transcriptional regulator n=1 Tax=Motilimonas TaxID=1914248 RepID=UPI001E2CDBAD|nr:MULTISPECIES: TraR/DksA C4-type zinc finger protein [unclassified Motilimonas]MDO6525856.1 TraR/DksA C4-type zinc finger protein [Motilimonas sp. 1_MG-2023]
MTEHELADVTGFQTLLTQQLIDYKHQVLAILNNAQQSSHQLAASQLLKLSNSDFIEAVVRLDMPQISEKVRCIKRIDAALCQIEFGLYGVCSDCEEAIEPELLSSDPTEQRCLSCKTKFEKRKKGFIAL